VYALLPWTQRLLSSSARSAESRVADEVAFWRQAWSIVSERLGGRILQMGFDTMVSGPLGHHLGARAAGDVDLVRRANAALREALPDSSYFVDLEQVAAARGKNTFYDPRHYAWTKQPFSALGLSDVARHLVAGTRALVFGPKKVLVLDLDNTLWDGVVGERGALGVGVGETPAGEAFLAFQRYAAGLARRGVLLSVCSKNNPEDARAPFEQHPDMALRLKDFACFEASWAPKDVGIRRMAETLRLGLDSFVFFDDNPAEREQIRQALPDVEVVDVPSDPAEYVRALDAGLWFEAIGVSAEDLRRSEQYQQEQARVEALERAGSIDDYLASLAMRGVVDDIGRTNMARVVQLIGKTNQFNVTTRRHSEADVVRLVEQPRALGLTLSLTDRFGDHGLVSVLLAVPERDDADRLRIDTWLMSCRVIARTAEDFLFNTLVEKARAHGYTRLVGEFIPTPKNALVSGLFERLGFTRASERTDGSVVYELALDGDTAVKTFVEAAER
jgi:FkbH-like protein